MDHKKTAAQPGGFTLADVYYLLFRRKWLILSIFGAGVAAALAVDLYWPFPYMSEAKLYVKYVSVAKPAQTEDSRFITPDERGMDILNTELQILTSGDLALEVADRVGPAKILAKKGGGTNRYEAAGVISQGLKVEVPPRTTIITLTYQHPDPTVLQPVLSAMIDAYIAKHTELRAGKSSTDVQIQEETDEYGSKLEETEKKLQEKKNAVNIISLEDAKKTYAEERSLVQVHLDDAVAEAAQCQSTLSSLLAGLSNAPVAKAADVVYGPVKPAPAAPTPEQVASYQRLLRQEATLQSDLDTLLISFTTNNSRVQAAQETLDRKEKEIASLKAAAPGLTAYTPAAETKAEPSGFDTQEHMIVEQQLKLTGLQGKMRTYTNQLALVQSKIALLNTAEGPITDLERIKDIEEAQYKLFLQKTAQAHIDEAMAPGHVSNIAPAENPLPPMLISKPKKTAVNGLIFGSLALGLGLAFLLEFVLKRSFRHAAEVKSKLGLSFFLSIPQTNGHEPKRWLGLKKVPLLANGASTANGAAAATNGANGHSMEPWDEKHELRPFHDTLRDRLIAYFEMINLTHKPKLVAVTSCDRHAGVTTIASGLASSLSETGDGNVLLVDMTVRDGEAHHFYKGKLTCGLDEVLEKEKRGEAKVQENLYVAKEFETNQTLPRVLPKRFSNLLPKMKASDFDYIIFDMPPISQISITPRLARFMDMVLMVVESERTDRDRAKQAMNLLAETKSNVGVILNKSRIYVPKALQQDL